MNAFEYAKYALTLFSDYDFVRSVEIQLLDEPIVKIKAHTGSAAFINIFYNAETLKYSFALIGNSTRIFGIDNAITWHLHPFDNPESHVEISDGTIKMFLDMLVSNKDKWYMNNIKNNLL